MALTLRVGFTSTMSRIDIQWLEDEHDCETCGWTLATGALVYINGELKIELEPIAHCYDSSSWDRDQVYLRIFQALGYTVEDNHGYTNDG